MKPLSAVRFASVVTTVLLIAGCGGGSDNGPTTTSVTTKVIDGAIRNALVCMDSNTNGTCDAAEPQGRTDNNGSVTLAIPNADVGRFPLLAVVGTDAVDADNGPVTVAFAMSAPADQSAVVSPLTTLVQRMVASTGASTADAARSVQETTGITTSLFQDFTTAAAPVDGSINAATVARMIVVTTQVQATAIAGTLGTMASDNTAITQADLDEAIQKKLLEVLPELVTALADPAVVSATTAAAREAAVQAAATTLVASTGLTPAAMPVTVAINNQAASTTPVTPAAPAATTTLNSLTYTDASNYFVRSLTGSMAQNTPDSSNNIKYVDRRQRSVAGNLAKWGHGGDPARQSDQHWNGNAWVACPINFENTARVRDAQGHGAYDYCDKHDTGSSVRASFDVSGRTMASVYAEARAAGFTNLTIADAAVTSLLASATFPANSSLFYQTSTTLTAAISYYPGSPELPGLSNLVSQFSAQVSAGGDASSQGAGVGCNSTETTTNGTNSTTLEGMMAAMSGTPCVFGPGSFVYQGVTYTSGASNEWWSNSTAGLGTIGNAPVGSGPAPGFYTTNTRLRVAFKGTGTNPVTYYACQERFNNGSTRNCTAIGTGTYTITTLGNARVLTLANPPVQAAPLSYNRVFVERGGLIYNGYQNKPNSTNTARFNNAATNALLTQLGLTPEDPSLPLALTAGSYQGTWDFRVNAETAVSLSMFIQSNGNISCQDRDSGSLPFYPCSVTITNPATGAFTYSDDTGTAAGSFDFMAGTGSGTYNDPTQVPSTGTFVARRR